MGACEGGVAVVGVWGPGAGAPDCPTVGAVVASELGGTNLEDELGAGGVVEGEPDAGGAGFEGGVGAGGGA